MCAALCLAMPPQYSAVRTDKKSGDEILQAARRRFANPAATRYIFHILS
jgi:hypothetical protein